jgi:hypothetical protein
MLVLERLVLEVRLVSSFLSVLPLFGQMLVFVFWGGSSGVSLITNRF